MVFVGSESKVFSFVLMGYRNLLNCFGYWVFRSLIFIDILKLGAYGYVLSCVFVFGIRNETELTRVLKEN